MSEPQPDGVLTQIKQYRFVRELGRGGMGTVYEALDSRDGGRVAVKLLHPWLAAQDPSFRDRFEREAHIAALLRSPYSVRLLDFGAVDGTYFLVMEFVEGTSLSALLEEGPLDPVRALRIAIDVARALEEAAARGVVHRDIKPDNVMLTPDGRVKLTDFGIARQAGGAGLTSAGAFVGTPAYAAPEQAVGEADERSDIYSLGATLYCMLTGRPPFSGGSAYEILRQHQSADVPMEPLAALPNAITFPLRRCLEKDPRDRYQSAAELAGALERGLATYLRTGPTTPGAEAGRAGAVYPPLPPRSEVPETAPLSPRPNPVSAVPSPPQPSLPPPAEQPAAATRIVHPATVSMASPEIPRTHAAEQDQLPGPSRGWLRRHWWKGFAFVFFLHGVPALVVAIRDRNPWYGALALAYSVPVVLAGAATETSAENAAFALWFLAWAVAIVQVFVLPGRVAPADLPWTEEGLRLKRAPWYGKTAAGVWLGIVLLISIGTLASAGD